jgi:hypothetical protein
MLPLYNDERTGRSTKLLSRLSGGHSRAVRSGERILQYAAAACLLVPVLLLVRHQVGGTRQRHRSCPSDGVLRRVVALLKLPCLLQPLLSTSATRPPSSPPAPSQPLAPPCVAAAVCSSSAPPERQRGPGGGGAAAGPGVRAAQPGAGGRARRVHGGGLLARHRALLLVPRRLPAGGPGGRAGRGGGGQGRQRSGAAAPASAASVQPSSLLRPWRWGGSLEPSALLPARLPACPPHPHPPHPKHTHPSPPAPQVPGEPQSFIDHIALGVQAAAQDPTALLLFSGGQTRRAAGPRSEGLSYWQVADAAGWFNATGVRERAFTEVGAARRPLGACRPRLDAGHASWLRCAGAQAWGPPPTHTPPPRHRYRHPGAPPPCPTPTKRTHQTPTKPRPPGLQEHARDSFENLLFSLCRFYELAGHYPQHVTVVSYRLKERRFQGLHRAALGWPEGRFSFRGTELPAGVKGAQEVCARAPAGRCTRTCTRTRTRTRLACRPSGQAGRLPRRPAPCARRHGHPMQPWWPWLRRLPAGACRVRRARWRRSRPTPTGASASPGPKSCAGRRRRRRWRRCCGCGCRCCSSRLPLPAALLPTVRPLSLPAPLQGPLLSRAAALEPVPGHARAAALVLPAAVPRCAALEQPRQLKSRGGSCAVCAGNRFSAGGYSHYSFALRAVRQSP